MEKTMLNNIPGMVYQCLNDPPNYTFTYISEGCKALTGYSPQELTKLGIKRIVHPDDAQTLIDYHEATLSVGLQLETTFRMITKNEEEKIILVRSSVVDTDAQGMPNKIEGIYIDITKQLRYETSKRVNRGKMDFLSKMSHEIRTPMNAIIGMAEIGLREDIPDQVREYTHAIKRAGGNLIHILNDIMDYTKIQNNDLEIFPEEYRISTVIENVIREMQPKAENRGLDFVVHVSSNLPDMFVGDATRIRRILSALLHNAIKFTDIGTVSLSIEGNINGSLIELILKVEDTGRGIKAEDISDIFTEFTQFDTKNIEGIGLGLFITKNLVELLGGEISVASICNVGSIFTVTLSQRIRRFDPILTIIKCYDDVNIGGFMNITAPSARVLIVDDISSNLIVAKGLLRPYEMQIDMCESGAEAIEAVKNQAYDLILMDHMMPVMDGIETTICIRKLDVDCKTDCKNVSIVALTANTVTKRGLFKQSGFNDFMNKPIIMSELNTIIEKWVPKEKQIEQKHLGKQVLKTEANIKIEDVDVKAGIKMTGGTVDGYLQVLEAYHQNGQHLQEEIERCVENNNIKLYTIHVHALNSASASIGAESISKAADALENAGDQNDVDFIKENTPLFLEQFKKLLNDINLVLSQKANSPSTVLLKQELISLQNAFDAYDVIEMDRYAKEVQKYLLDPNIGSAINKLMQYKILGEYESAVALIDEILKEV